jgi:hypothetical protein
MSGITTAAAKIYELVPKMEYWDKAQLQRETIRANINVAPDALAGCLDSLVHSGLVKEKRGTFCRVPIKPPTARSMSELKDIVITPEEIPMSLPTPTRPAPPMPTIAPAKAGNVVDALGALAQRLNAMALRHQMEFQELASELSDLAIDVQGDLEAKDTGLAQLRQLQTLLKTIGG